MNINLIWLVIIIACAFVVFFRMLAVSRYIRTQRVSSRAAIRNNLIVIFLATAVILGWILAAGNPSWSANIALLVVPATVIAYCVSFMTIRTVSASNRKVLLGIITGMVVVFVIGAIYTLIKGTI